MSDEKHTTDCAVHLGYNLGPFCSCGGNKATRNEALEEAAKEAEDVSYRTAGGTASENNYDPSGLSMGVDIATAIRVLKELP